MSQNSSTKRRQSLGPQRNEKSLRRLWDNWISISAVPLLSSASAQNISLHSQFLHSKKWDQGGQPSFPPSWEPWQETCPCLNSWKACQMPEGRISLKTGREKGRKWNCHPQPWKLWSVTWTKEMPNQSDFSATPHHWRYIPQDPWAWTLSQPSHTARISPLGPPLLGQAVPQLFTRA